MAGYPLAVSSGSPEFRAGTAALLVLALTSVHHVQGAIVYETPWRMHVLLIAAPGALAIAGALLLGRWRQNGLAGRIATWGAALMILAFPVAMVGVFEGAYNHVVKNIVYFGLGEATARAMFPPPSYEMPDNLLFELTGMAQFPLAVIAAVLAIRLLGKQRGGATVAHR